MKRIEIENIIEIGKSNEIEDIELHDFLPNLPRISGSELIFNAHWMDARKLSNIQVINLIKGLHKIEAEYMRATNSSFGFGSPSCTYTIISGLAERDISKAKELEVWVALNGGNYYIKKCNDIKDFKPKIKTLKMQKEEYETSQAEIDYKRELKKEKRNKVVKVLKEKHKVKVEKDRNSREMLFQISIRELFETIINDEQRPIHYYQEVLLKRKDEIKNQKDIKDLLGKLKDKYTKRNPKVMNKILKQIGS